MAGGDRSNRDSLVIAALAGGATVAAAAQQAGVSERTVWRRLQDEPFRRALDEAQRQGVQTAVAGLGRASTRAVRTLVALMSTKQRPTVRLAAARAVLEMGTRLREQNELEARIEALEAALLAHQPHQQRRRQS